MEWFYFAFIATALFAAAMTIDKIIVSKYFKTGLHNAIITTIVEFLAAAGIFIFIKFEIPSIWFAALGILNGFIWALAVLVYFKAVSHEDDISGIAPIFLVIPLIVAVFSAVFLNEILRPIQYIGIIAIVSGAIALSMKAGKFRLSKAAMLMILASVLFAASYVLDKFLLGFSDYWNLFAWTSTGLAISGVFLLSRHHKDFFAAITKYRKAAAAAFLSETIAVTGSLLIVIAASLTAVSLVSAIPSFQPLIVLVFAAIVTIIRPDLLKEDISMKNIARKGIAIIAMIAGAFLLV